MATLLRIPVFLLLFALALSTSGCSKEQATPSFKEGDLIFQITTSPQSKAIQMATGSEYTHCGIILEKDGKLQVFEALTKVGFVPIEQWIRRGVKGHYVVMRLKDPSVLTPDIMKKMHHDSTYFAGRDYDLLFQWSDKKIYCSELVWKLYKRTTGLELGKLHTFSDYDLNHDEIRQIIRQRYGQDFRLDEKVIAPSDVMKSQLLEVVIQN